MTSKKLVYFSIACLVALNAIGDSRLHAQQLISSDVIHLRTGVVLDGRILREDERSVWITYDLISDKPVYPVLKRGILTVAYGNGTTTYIGASTVFVPRNSFERSLSEHDFDKLTALREEYYTKRKKARSFGVKTLVLGSLGMVYGFYGNNPGGGNSYRVGAIVGTGVSLIGMLGIISGVKNRKRAWSVNAELERRGIDPLNPGDSHPDLKKCKLVNCTGVL